MAGIAIFPAVFSFGISPEEGGAGLVFVTLPNVFLQMPGGYLFSVMFFLHYWHWQLLPLPYLY